MRYLLLVIIAAACLYVYIAHEIKPTDHYCTWTVEKSWISWQENTYYSMSCKHNHRATLIQNTFSLHIGDTVDRRLNVD